MNLKINKKSLQNFPYLKILLLNFVTVEIKSIIFTSTLRSLEIFQMNHTYINQVIVGKNLELFTNLKLLLTSSINICCYEIEELNKKCIFVFK